MSAGRSAQPQRPGSVEYDAAMQVGHLSGIVHTGAQVNLIAEMLENSTSLKSKKKLGKQNRHVVLNATSGCDIDQAVLSINGIYQEWVLRLGTKLRNDLSYDNNIAGDVKRELVKQSRRYKHNRAQVTYSRKLLTARVLTEDLSGNEE